MQACTDELFLSYMVSVFRFLALSLLSVLIGTGLIGCAVFSAGAQEGQQGQQAAHERAMSTASSGHQHHSVHSTADTAPMSASDEHGPAHGGHDSHCDGCGQSVLNRISVAPDQAISTGSVPQPVFIVPATLQLETRQPQVRVHKWPPDHSAPAIPRTLTHQKISLLI